MTAYTVRHVQHAGKTYRVYPNSVLVIVPRTRRQPWHASQYTRYLKNDGKLALLVRAIADKEA
jgi:hypothetical protein